MQTMGKLRKIILLVFVGVYLVAAPLTILYALWYIFSPAQQTLLQTGLVSLNTEPPSGPRLGQRFSFQR